MPKVLRIINRFNLGGPTYNATFLTRFLPNHFETKLVGGIHDKDETDSLHIPQKYDVTPILLKDMKRSLNPLNDIRTFFEIVRIIKEFKPDIVHTHAAKAGALGRIAAWYCGVPIRIHTFHGHVFHSYFSKPVTFLVKSTERLLAKLSTAIVVISPKQQYEIVEQHKICSPEKAHVIPLGFDLSAFYEKSKTERCSTRQIYELTEDCVAIAIIGRLAPVKNHLMFLESLKKLTSNTDQFKVFIVGDGSEKNNLYNAVSKLPEELKSRILFTSWIHDIASFNAGMDIICLTSDNEGTPVSLIEAQASGVPVITTNVGGVSDIVLDGITGYVVPPRDSKLFAEKLDILIQNREKREEMSKKGWENVRDSYDYTILVNNMANLYESLLMQSSK